MTYRQLGDSGLTSRPSASAATTSAAASTRTAPTPSCAQALDTGITLFDTADIYGAGRERGDARPRARGRRDNVVVATKFGMDMQGANGPDWGVRGSRRYVRKAVESSLRRLGTDWIDLYQLHRPDPATPIDETLAALDELVREGKVRYLGTQQLHRLAGRRRRLDRAHRRHSRFVSAQNEYSLLERDVEEELVPACEHVGVGLLPFFPLASGLLTGKYRRGEPAPEGTRLAGMADRLDGADWDTIEALEAYAAERGLRPIDVAIGGLAAQPAVASVIAGATRPEQVVDNVRAGLWEPTAEDLVELDAVTTPPA